MGNLNENRVVLGMSGGVDSSVAACLLKEQGFEVFGVSMELYSCDRPMKKGCCTPADRLDARKVCEQLKVPFEVLDLRSQFRDQVIGYFAHEYGKGRTPLPCAPCNKNVRFKSLLDYADEKGAHWIATGHYARILQNGEGSYSLLKGKELKKDQSYFLWQLSQTELRRLQFPIGHLKKEEVRAIAKQYNLITSEKKESQEVCFVGDQDYASYLEEHFPSYTFPEGHFVDSGGRVLGKHRGVHAYTVGQRRGLNLSLGERTYVLQLNAKKNEVVLGNREGLRARGLVAKGIHWISNPSKTSGFVKIRSTHVGTKAKFEMEGDLLRIFFDEPQELITPGQAAVLYDGDCLLGGAWIEEAIHLDHIQEGEVWGQWLSKN